VQQILNQHYGFDDFELLENAARRDTLKALERLSQRALPNDSVLVYYAGHGFIDADSNRGFWVPVDAEGIDNSTFLRNSTIRDEPSTIASRTRHTLLISDSCFSGTLLRRGSRSIDASNQDEGYFKKVSSKKSVQIIAAGGVEFVDDNYQASGHSPFTYFLLNELKHNDRQLLTVSELSNNVSIAVANNVEQVPESGVLQGAGDELGEFIFLKLNIGVKGVPVENVRVEVNVVPVDEDAQANIIQIMPTKTLSQHFYREGLFMPLPPAKSTFQLKIEAPYGEEWILVFASDNAKIKLPGRPLDNGLLLITESVENLPLLIQQQSLLQFGSAKLKIISQAQ
jgi:hypothetical protein